MTTRPTMTGSTPLSPLRIRKPHARTYSPRVCAAIAGGSSAAAASGAAVRSAAASAAEMPCLGARATGAAQPSRGHVLDDALTVKCGRLVLHDKAPQVAHRDAIGDLEDVIQVVRDDHDRESAVAQALDEVEHHLGMNDAERGGRLVHDHQLRVPHHRFG